MATMTIASNVKQETHSKRGNYGPEMQAAISAGYITLARALVRQALADAIKHKDAATREEAAAWLMDENGQELAELSGFDTALISRWIRAGCPGKTERMQ